MQRVENGQGRRYASVRSEPVLPAELGRLGPDEESGGADVDAAGKDDELLVLAAVGLDDASGNGNANQAGKGDDGVGGGVVAAVLLRLAHAADADGRDGNARAAGEAKEHGEDDDAGAGVAERQPDAEARHEGEEHRQQAGVEGANDVGVVPGQAAADDGAGVHDGDEVVGVRLAETLVDGVRRDVGEGDEEGKLEQEDANGGERKGHLAEDARVRVRCGVLGRREAGAHEQDADAAADEADKGHDARGPAKADALKEVSQHEGEDDAAKPTCASGDAGGEAATGLEPVADGGNGRGEDERRSETAKDAKG